MIGTGDKKQRRAIGGQCQSRIRIVSLYGTQYRTIDITDHDLGCHRSVINVRARNDAVIGRRNKPILGRLPLGIHTGRYLGERARPRFKIGKGTLPIARNSQRCQIRKWRHICQGRCLHIDIEGSRCPGCDHTGSSRCRHRPLTACIDRNRERRIGTGLVAYLYRVGRDPSCRCRCRR